MNRFELLRGMDGHYYFLLKSENNLALVMSQGYATKRAAIRGIEMVRRLALQADVVDRCVETEPTSRS
ncbi:MAG: YegP family protein [Candidatus Obscuribacterales bacterium]